MPHQKKKAVVEIQNCVACGCCEKICPLKAIMVIKGIYAEVDENKCVGCGKCEIECPASIISIVEKEAIIA